MYLWENSKKLVKRMYNIGNKVLTEYGSGKIKKINELEKTVTVKLDDGINIGIHLERDFIKPNSAHHKLIEYGFTLFDEDSMGIIYRDETRYINISKTSKSYWLEVISSNTYTENVPEVDLKLSRILTEYLEELNNE